MSDSSRVMRRLTLKREVNEVGTGCAGDIDQLGGVLRLVVMRVFLTGTQHLTHRDFGSGCARQETLAPMKNDTPNNSPGESSTVGGSEFMKAPVEVQWDDTEAQLIDASRNPPSTSTATCDGSVVKPSELASEGESPAYPTAKPSAVRHPLVTFGDLVTVFGKTIELVEAQVSMLDRSLARAERRSASNRRPRTPGTVERTNGQ